MQCRDKILYAAVRKFSVRLATSTGHLGIRKGEVHQRMKGLILRILLNCEPKRRACSTPARAMAPLDVTALAGTNSTNPTTAPTRWWSRCPQEDSLNELLPFGEYRPPEQDTPPSMLMGMDALELDRLLARLAVGGGGSQGRRSIRAARHAARAARHAQQAAAAEAAAGALKPACAPLFARGAALMHVRWRQSLSASAEMQ